MTKISHAMVLAAGLGTRMRPLTDHLPKPLIPVAGKPILDHIHQRIAAAGIPNIVVNTFHHSDRIIAWAQETGGITLSCETTLLETGGGVQISLSHGLLPDDAPFAVINGDTLWLEGETPALQRLQQHWDEKRMDALLLLYPAAAMPQHPGKGDFFLQDDGRLQRRGSAGSAPYIFMGAQLLHPRLFAGSPEGAFSLNIIYNRALESDRLHGLVHDGRWFHISTPDDVRAANIELPLLDLLQSKPNMAVNT